MESDKLYNLWDDSGSKSTFRRPLPEVKKIQKQRMSEAGKFNEIVLWWLWKYAKTDPTSYSGDEQQTFLSLRTGRDFPHRGKNNAEKA